MQNGTRVEQSKFDRGPTTAQAIDAGELPWAYGDNRITAIVRDPESAYLYWEVTDEGLADARGRLGPAGESGWCCLRIYDTTGREFDGINANDYFDVRVEREDREYFLMIRRPGSALHVEIGVKTHEGFFQPIARSGRAAFPGSGPSTDGTVAWMTVTSDDAPPAAAPFRSRYAGPEPPLPGRAEPDVWHASYQPHRVEERFEPPPHASAWLVQRHVERHVHTERWWRHNEASGRSRRGGITFLRWEHFDPERVAIELFGEMPTHLHVEGGEMVVFGPWHVTIRGFETAPQRRILSTWSVRWVRATTPTIERWERFLERRLRGSSLSTARRSSRGRPSSTACARAARASCGAWAARSACGWARANGWPRARPRRSWRGRVAARVHGGERVPRRQRCSSARAARWAIASERVAGSQWMGGSEQLGGSELHMAVNNAERWAERPAGK